MPTYYVGLGGNDANNGLTWATRKLTLNGAEDVPVVAGDIVYVAPGVYRELLTCDVSGGAGSPITYIGDVTGEHTDGVGGVVRITGSDNDQTATRASCITSAAQRDYRTFRGFMCDTTTSHTILGTNSSNWIVEDCVVLSPSAAAYGIYCVGTPQAAWIVRRCVVFGHISSTCIRFRHSATIDNTGHLVENCMTVTGATGIEVERIGGVTVKNCTVQGMRTNGIAISIALTAGQTFTVNNCIITQCLVGLQASAADGTFVENYNTIYACPTERTNVGVGANSVSYPPLFQPPILHSGASQVSGFKLPWWFGELSPWSQVRAITGTAEPAIDMRGMARPATAAKNSWGAIQYQNHVRDTATVHGGAVSLELSDAGRRQFWIPIGGVSITISVYVYLEANYAGNAPQMIIKQPGQADQATTATGATGAWELLTDTLTPAADTEWVCVELASRNTAAAGNYATYFDDLTVDISPAIGEMETWLWDTEVGDWVQAAGVCDYPDESDVLSGVVYGDGDYTGTLVCRRGCSRWPDYVACN